MIKDLFHSPPIYKANIHLSWKEGDAKSAQKRRLISAPAAADRPGKVFSMHRIMDSFPRIVKL